VVTQAPTATCATQPDPFTVYFEWDKSDLTANNREIISQALSRAKAGGCNVTLTVIQGYTDTSGKASYNDKLSARRADVVKQELISGGLPASAITTEAKGETDLAKPTKDGVREPLNRRAVVSITIGK
jgi:outer membrane protein OmpA-like peptidoglycan-associated protein